MNHVDLHRTLATMAEDGPRRAAPTGRLLARVHRRRAARAMTTSAVGVAAAGALAMGGLGWLPDLSRVPAPTAEAAYSVVPATDAPTPTGAHAVWDLYPASSLDVSTAPTRQVTEALAALTVYVSEAGRPESGQGIAFVMDAADGAWVRPAWPDAERDSAAPAVSALSPDGRTVAAAVYGDARPALALIDVATGTRTAVDGLALEGAGCWLGGTDFTADGTGLAVLTVCDRGPECSADGLTRSAQTSCAVDADRLAVFRVDLATMTTTLLTQLDGTNLAEGGTLEYSPDGSLLAIGSYDAAEPYGPRTTVLDAEGAIVREWPTAIRAEPVWYGNNALRASQLEQTDLGEWKGYLIVSSGEAVGEIRLYGESPWQYGTPPQPSGDTHGQVLRGHTPTPDAPWAFEIDDVATGTVRGWLSLTASDAKPEAEPPSVVAGPSTLIHRDR